MTWNEVENERREIVDTISKMTFEQQTTPVGKSFSPVDMLMHLAMVDKIYANSITKPVPANLASNPGKGNFIYRIVCRQMRKPGTVPAPKPFTPSSGMTFEVASAELESVRSQIAKALEGLPLDRACMKHPLFGKLSPSAIVGILNNHQFYHRSRLPKV